MIPRCSLDILLPNPFLQLDKSLNFSAPAMVSRVLARARGFLAVNIGQARTQNLDQRLKPFKLIADIIILLKIFRSNPGKISHFHESQPLEKSADIR
jgi:hypothetical protein